MSASLRPRHERRIPALAVTAFAGSEDRQRAREAGFDVHLAKPPNLAALESLLSLSHDDIKRTRAEKFLAMGRAI